LLLPVFKPPTIKPVAMPASLQSEDNTECAFGIKGTTRHNYPPAKQTVYQYSNTDDLHCLRENTRRKRLGLWPTKYVLHHSNASSDSSLQAKQFLSNKQTTMWNTHPTLQISLLVTFSISRTKRFHERSPFWQRGSV
jgi:hypothetical protein